MDWKPSISIVSAGRGTVVQSNLTRIGSVFPALENCASGEGCITEVEDDEEEEEEEEEDVVVLDLGGCGREDVEVGASGFLEGSFS